MNSLYYSLFLTTLSIFFSANQDQVTSPLHTSMAALADDCSQVVFPTPDPNVDIVLSEVCVTQTGSDWYYTLTYEHLFDDLCDCSEDEIYLMGKNGSLPSFTTFIFNDFTLDVDADGGDGSFQVNIGPSANENLFVYFLHLGEDYDFAGNCTLFNEDCADAVILDNVNPVTDALYPPANVEASENIADDRILVTWEKGTDAPEEYTKYAIYKDGSFLAEVNGNVYEYLDTGMQPGEEHFYEVATRTVAGLLLPPTIPDGNLLGSSNFRTLAAEESVKAGDQGTTLTVGLQATDGTKYSVTLLEWFDLSKAAEDIRVERSNTDGTDLQELDILNKNATSFTDDSGIPGYEYTYYVTPIAEGLTFETGSDNGYSRPNGIIKGHVRSSLGAGVSGVDINVSILSDVPPGGAPLPGGCDDVTITYCTSTDSEGYYEIKNIYYHEDADFSIVPSKTGLVDHEFSPEAANRSLDVNAKTAAGVDFTDLTVFTAAGTVTYPPDSPLPACGVPGVSILINNEDLGVQTDGEGYWSFAIQDEGVYTFTPKFEHHTFENPMGDSSTTRNIVADATDIDFEDTQTDSLQIIAQGGCGSSLGDYVEIQLTADGNCYNQTYQTDANGFLTLYNLPARKYSVMVTGIETTSTNLTNMLDQIGNIPVEIDLTVRDTVEQDQVAEETTIIPEITETLPNDSVVIIQEADTIYAGDTTRVKVDVAPKVSFIYRSPLDVNVSFADAGATETTCASLPQDDDNVNPGQNIIVMEQGLSYTLIFEVKELLGEDCYIDTGYLKIYDYISDRGNEGVEVEIKGGYAVYTVDAGEPEVATNGGYHDYEKLLYVIPNVDLVDPEPLAYWVLVTGAKGNTPSFITRTPEIPWLILHDPPGDNSYAYVEEGTSFSSFTTNESFYGGSAGAYANLLIGAKIITPFSGTGFGTTIDFEIEAGRDNLNRDGLVTTMTFKESFSTSSLENLTGPQGDVFIGAAYNQEFSLAEELTYDAINCAVNLDVVPKMAATDFATTFVYTELHVENTLLPTISFLKDNILDDREFSTLTLEEQVEVNNLIADSVTWELILAKNRAARDTNAVFEENISFSAGAPISREFETEVNASTSYEYNIFVNTEFAVGAKIDNEGGAWFDSQLGVMGKFRYSTTTIEGSESTDTRTVGYVLDDGDIGDFFSVDILEDQDYDVPAFNLKLGTTSCPQEEGTQARDRPTIQIIPPELSDVPADGEANFTAILTNRSESRETREYAVRVVSTTNPDGARVYLGGQLINNGAANFFLNYNEGVSVNLSVLKGPIANNYSNIGIMIYPPCEYDLWQDGGNLVNADTAFINVLNFQSECTSVTLRNPDDGWLINQNTGDIMQTTFSGYDLNNENFISLTLQVKPEGEGYADFMTILKEDLLGPNYDLFVDLSSYPDGAYRIRARANCGTEGVTYSSEKKGFIDRSSLAPFGIPSPSDGFLRFGQEISVTFDKEIDCGFPGSYQPVVTLWRSDDSTFIPATASCFGNKVILNTTPHLTEISSLAGVEVFARVDSLRDLNGNIQEYGTEWSFLVNVNPVFWDPESVFETGQEGNAHTITGTLKNNTFVSKEFSLAIDDNPSIISYPGWLTPVQKRGTILPSDDYIVEFELMEGLSPGIYTGVVTALVDGEPLPLDITFELLANPVNWDFDASKYEYSMTVVTQFSMDQTDLALSEDTRDLIAAYVDGEIRGITNIEYLPGPDLYRAFLTVFSNDAGGGGADEITFRFWEALTGIEYGAMETLTFEDEWQEGTILSPFILHPRGTFQVIPLRVGWNWISFNVLSDDMSRESVFQSIMKADGANTITIKSDNNQTSEFNSNTGWQGNLTGLSITEGYLLHLSDEPDTLYVVGNEVSAPISSSIVSGWNWIGYPRAEPRPVDSVLQDLSPSPGDLLRSQKAFAEYLDAANGWEGNLKEMRGGNGYKLRLGSPGTILYRNGAYEMDPARWEHNMNVTAHLDLSQFSGVDAVNLQVGAFIDGQCRGVASLSEIDILDDHRVFLLVHGARSDLDKPVELRVLDAFSGKESIATNQVGFVPDALVGSVRSPYEVLFENDSGFSFEDALEVHPNPTKGQIRILFTLRSESNVRMELFQADGRAIQLFTDDFYPVGNYAHTTDISTLSEGVYYLRWSTSNAQGVHKILKH